MPFDLFNVFNETTFRQGTLYVPKGTKDLYICFDGWREFLNIVEMDGIDDDDNPDTPAPNGECAIPVIFISGNKVRFECRTPGAEFTSTLTTEEQFTGSEVVIGGKPITYTLTVYATAPGYSRSKPAMVKLTLSRGDVNGDGIVGIGDIVEITNIMAGKE